MKVKPISRSMKATALTNPNPSFVSQVKAGANGKAWRAVKMDAAVPVDDNTPEEDMKLKPVKKSAGTTVVAAVAPKGYGVMQFEFAKSAFADEAAVNAWMEAGGYSDYTVTSTKSGFQIENDDAKFIAGSVSKIDGFATGVSAFVGKLSNPEAEEPEEGDAAETAAKSAEAIAEGTTPKVDPAPRTRAEQPAAEGEPAAEPAAVEPTVVAETPADISAPAEPVEAVIPAEQPAVEAVPDVVVADVQPVAPAEGEVAPAAGAEPQTDVEKAAEIVVRADQTLRSKGVYEASRLGEIVNQLAWIVYDADYSGLSEATVTQIKSAAQSLLDAFMAAAADAANELTEVFKSATERAKAAAPIVAPVVETPLDIAALVAAEVKKAIAPVEARASAAEAAATEASERAVTAERGLAERVEADNARGQTRKGAEDPVIVERTDKPTGGRSQASKSILSSFGSRHAN